jgi:hypothetical protein
MARPMQSRHSMLNPRAFTVLAALLVFVGVRPAAAQFHLVPESAPVPSLAAAAKEAIRLRQDAGSSGHASPLYTLVGPPRAARERAVVPVSTPADVPVRPQFPTFDRPFWQDRMRLLQTQRANDQTVLATASVIWRGLDQGPWYDAVTDLTRSTAAVQTDTRAIGDLELEAHRAGVPPGWLVRE